MRHVHLLILLTFIGGLFYQCRKDVGYIGSGDHGQELIRNPIKANLQGNVLDENGQPAANVVIKAGTETTVTDNKGYFRINNASLDKNASLVTAEKTGYFIAYRTFSATSGTNQVVITLTKKNLSGTVNGASGGDVSLTNGTKISLPANGIVRASDNSNYTGTVNVYAAYIDPTAADISSRVPGSFMANDKDGKRVFLSSYGMMAVELESSTGEKLQIKPGNTATLTSPIPSSRQATAPATIALWYMDERTGLWMEEGTATKQGSAYVGTVKHFSFWNCDIGIPALMLSATLKTSNSQPLVNAQVVIKANDYGAASGYTDSLGDVRVLVPANVNLAMEVKDDCGSSIYSKNIGTLTGSADLGSITVTPTGSSILTVQGKITNCSGAAVTNGYAILTVNNWVRYAKVDASGNFSTNYVLCNATSATVQALGVDETAQQQGNIVSFPVTLPTTDVGNISACNAEFINYTIDANSYSLAPPDTFLGRTITQFTPYFTDIGGQGTSNTISFSFQSSSIATGTYPMSSLWLSSFFNQTIVPHLSVTITNFPPSSISLPPPIVVPRAQYYEGSFSGQFIDANITHNITCSFRVIRR